MTKYKNQAKTPEEMLEDLRRKRAELGRNPTIEDLKSDSNMASAAKYRAVFGSLNNALGKLDPLHTTKAPRGQFGTKSESDRLLTELLKKTDKLGRMPSKMEIDHLYGAPGSYQDFLDIFGTYSNMTRQVKALRPKINTSYTDESLLNDLRLKVSESNGGYRYRDFDSDKRMPHISTYRIRFGSLNNALLKAGINVPADSIGRSASINHRRYSKAEVIAKLRDRTAKLGYRPTMQDINKDMSMPTANTIISVLECNNWSMVLSIAGLDHLPTNRRMPMKEDEAKKEAEKNLAIKKLQNLAEKLGHTPSGLEIDIDPETPNARFYITRFGNMRKAMEAAGLEPRKPGRPNKKITFF